MAWVDSLLQASFRGVPFEVMAVGRRGGRVIVEHEYPYVAGADLEDMSLRARQVRVRAFFWGDDYENQLDAFIKALEVPGAGELIHPIHGSMTVLAADWDDDHEAEQIDSASVNVVFIESVTRSPVFTVASNSAKRDEVVAQAGNARAAADNSLARYIAKLQIPGLRRITLFKDAFNQAKEQLSSLMKATTGSVKLLLSDLDPFVYPRAYMADLLSVIDIGLQGLPFGGRNLLYLGQDTSTGSGASDFAIARRQLDPAAVVITPAVPAPNADMVADAAVVEAHARTHAAAAIAEAAAIVLAGELEGTLLERADVEALTNQTRAAVQVAIASARTALDAEGRSDTCTALRSLAYAVEEAARAVINQRPPLVTRKAPVSGPVRLVAHQIYGDASRAQEIVRLNRLGRAVLIELGEDLSVYSS